MHAIRASARHTRAIRATAELLAKLRMESVFVGSVARAAWLGDPIEGGSIDALALMNPPQKNQLAMMASNRGFRVEREEIEQSVELDLVPLNFIDEEGDVRVHVLLASNALYGRMVRDGVFLSDDENRRAMSPPSVEIRVPRAEDFALLVMLSADEEAIRRMRVLPGFDNAAFDERLVSIGMVRS
jgi:hypothetical protein